VNLSGVHTEDLSRGMVLSAPGAIAPVHAVDVRLHATSILAHPLADGAGVTFLAATSESEARVRLLDTAELRRGEDAWAQIVLESPVALLRGDHCVIRTPNETVAGGVIVAVNPKRHRRNHEPTIEALERQLEGSPAERLLDLLAAGPRLETAIATQLSLEPAAAATAIAEAISTGDAVRIGPQLFAGAWLASAVARILEVTNEFLAANNLRAAAPREHVRGASRLDASAFDAVLASAIAAGRLSELPGGGIAPPGYEPTLSPAQQQTVDAFLGGLRAGGYSPPTDHVPDAPLLAYLAGRGLIEAAGAGVVFDATIYADMVEKVRQHLASHGSISLAETRDLFTTSRKYAQAFLEHLDATRVTRRTGDVRTLR
jgi:selenocysteine-specific elongation factor